MRQWRKRRSVPYSFADDPVFAISRTLLLKLAAKQATTTIPIVFTIAADPVGNGLVSSLAHPGGNVTGCSIQLSDISAKRLQLLTEAVPSVSRAAVLWNPHTPYHKTLLKEVEVAAPSLRLQPVPIAAQDPREFEGAFAAMAKAKVSALFVRR